MSDLRSRIADEISSIQVGSGYESTTIGITAALEAADALIAAGVVAEEPEWEYGFHINETSTRDRIIPDSPGGLYSPDRGTRVRRHRAGPWVPVKQEGAENADSQ